MAEDTMFGVPDAEHVHVDPASVWESEIEQYAPELGERTGAESWTIEEWAMRPITFGQWAAFNAAETAVENLWDEIDESAAEQLHNASKADDVVAAFQAALDLLASKVNYMMCDEIVAKHQVTLDADGEPMFNGEPLYGPSRSAMEQGDQL